MFNLCSEGDLLNELDCRGVGNPYLVDYQLRVLPHTNPDGSVPEDELAVTDIKFRCSNVNDNIKSIRIFILMVIINGLGK